MNAALISIFSCTATIYQFRHVHLKPHKASGPDNIPVFFLKETANEIAPILVQIFQFSLDQGVLPSDWKTANIIPIFKKGKSS